mgnify:CR=1 FL=1
MIYRSGIKIEVIIFSLGLIGFLLLAKSNWNALVPIVSEFSNDSKSVSMALGLDIIFLLCILTLNVFIIKMDIMINWWQKYSFILALMVVLYSYLLAWVIALSPLSRFTVPPQQPRPTRSSRMP